MTGQGTHSLGHCISCGQTCIADAGYSIGGTCPECRYAQYGGRTRTETVRLFEPAPEQLEGQTTMEGME